MSILLRYQQALRNCQQELRKCQNELVQSGEQIVDLNKRIEDEKKSRQSVQRNYEKYARTMGNAYKQKGKRFERNYNTLWILIFIGIGMLLALVLFKFTHYSNYYVLVILNNNGRG